MCSGGCVDVVCYYDVGCEWCDACGGVDSASGDGTVGKDALVAVSL